MAGVIVFLDKTQVPNNLTEIHFFEDDLELIRFSTAHLDRKHLVRAVEGKCWHRTPGPATKAMLGWCVNHPGFSASPTFQAFVNEWLDTAPPPAPEQPASVRTMKCKVCGEPVAISDEAQLFHAHEVASHEAQLSHEDMTKVLEAFISKCK